jgi:hypothetical protein
LGGHVIDYGIGDDANPVLSAGRNHIGKLISVAKS